MPFRRRALLSVLLLLPLAASPARAVAELELVDGTVLRGTDVRREAWEYVLTFDDGREVAMPIELVARVRLQEEGQPAGAAAAAEGEEETPREAPSGLVVRDPQTLAGIEVEPPRPDAQLRALGPPAKFAPDLVNARWAPTTDWTMDPERTNNFNPARWAEAPIDPTWRPSPAFAAGQDVLRSSRATFAGDVVDTSWAPADAFATSVGSR